MSQKAGWFTISLAIVMFPWITQVLLGKSFSAKVQAIAQTKSLEGW
jgi:hypothetical protein